MYIYDISLTKLNKFLLPTMSESIFKMFDDGLYAICKIIEDDVFFIDDAGSRSYKLLNLFSDIAEDDYDSLKVLYILIHNTYDIARYSSNNSALSVAVQFLSELLDFLDNNGYTVECVYIFMLDKYYTEFYEAKLNFYRDLKTKSIKDVQNLILYIESEQDNADYFPGNNLSLDDIGTIKKNYYLIPNINMLSKDSNTSYRNYREAQEDHLQTLKSISADYKISENMTSSEIQSLYDWVALQPGSDGKYSSSQNIIYYDFPFLKLPNLKHSFLANSKQDKLMSFILGKWYDKYTVMDLYLFIIEFNANLYCFKFS